MLGILSAFISPWLLVYSCAPGFFITKNCNPVAIKKRMEKDVDEVGKIARTIKLRIEELDKEVKKCVACLIVVYILNFSSTGD